MHRLHRRDISPKRSDGYAFQDFRFVRLWLAIGWAMILLVVYFSLIPNLPEMATFKGGDKIEHLTAYLVLMVWFSNLYAGTKERMLIGAAFLSMGMVLEWIQYLTPYRTFQYTDAAANAAGIFVGWLLTKTASGTFLVKLDQALQRCFR